MAPAFPSKDFCLSIQCPEMIYMDRIELQRRVEGKGNSSHSTAEKDTRNNYCEGCRATKLYRFLHP